MDKFQINVAMEIKTTCCLLANGCLTRSKPLTGDTASRLLNAIAN